jgi:DNA invertase Pin-like site-specific DNA recombinase
VARTSSAVKLPQDPQGVLWYLDKETDDTLDRPEFERLQGDIFAGEVKTVVVWKLDRLSRSVRDGIGVLCDWCDRGIGVVSVTQQIDFNGTVGKLLAAAGTAARTLSRLLHRA